MKSQRGRDGRSRFLVSRITVWPWPMAMVGVVVCLLEVGPVGAVGSREGADSGRISGSADGNAAPTTDTTSRPGDVGDEGAARSESAVANGSEQTGTAANAGGKPVSLAEAGASKARWDHCRLCKSSTGQGALSGGCCLGNPYDCTGGGFRIAGPSTEP